MHIVNPGKCHVSSLTSDPPEPVAGCVYSHDLPQQDDTFKMYETRLELAANAAGAGLWSLDLDSYVFWTNGKIRDIFHFSRAGEITFEQFLDKVHPDDIPTIKNAMHKVLHEGVDLAVEYRIVLPDGSIRWIHSRGAQHSGTGENASCIMGASADVTERKMSELAVARQLGFEMLLAEISTTFARFSLRSDVDIQIEHALSRILDFFEGDRSGLIRLDLENRKTLITHAFYREGLERVPPDADLASMFPWTFDRSGAGECIYFSDLDELPPEAASDRQSWRTMGVKSALHVPIPVEDNVCCLILVQSLSKNIVWPQETLHRLQIVGEVFTNALSRKKTKEELISSYNQIAKLKEKLEIEADYLRAEVRASQPHDEIIGQSEPVKRVLAMVEQVASTSSTVLVHGETGTGKELVAQAVHNQSPRRDKLMVTVNCASLPSSLIESELFGRERGAYTGALTRQIGRFELADGSSIFLDEISELSLELQAKLLRVLQEGEFERLGSPATIKVNVRVIAATNRNLLEEVKKGKFREDLFYRLNVFPIVLPPLRERLADIPMLVWAFIREFNEKMGRKINKIAKREMASLQQYSWPGNIRELRNVIEHAVIVSSGDELKVRIPENTCGGPSVKLTLEEMERRYIEEILRQTDWNIKGVGGAAKILDMNPSTLYSRMKKLGISSHHAKGGMGSAA
jgi:formate hydrogenlyase transcriptional activator